MLANRRKFDGLWYSREPDEIYFSEAAAQRVARRLRKKGEAVRVLREYVGGYTDKKYLKYNTQWVIYVKYGFSTRYP